MAVTTETQAFLAETKAPSPSPSQLKNGLKAALAGIGKYQASLGTQVQLLNDALFAETDPQVSQKLETQKQTLGALRRELTEAENQLRDLAPILAQFVKAQADFRDAASALGYTV